MKQVTMIIQDDDMKVLKPLLNKLDIDYTQKTIKEVVDPYALKMEKEWLKSPVLTEAETKQALKDMGMNV